jgi:hypothetical protein
LTRCGAQTNILVRNDLTRPKMLTIFLESNQHTVKTKKKSRFI